MFWQKKPTSSNQQIEVNMPVSCRSLADRCGSLGSCKPQFFCSSMTLLIHKNHDPDLVYMTQKLSASERIDFILKFWVSLCIIHDWACIPSYGIPGKTVGMSIKWLMFPGIPVEIHILPEKGRHVTEIYSPRYHSHRNPKFLGKQIYWPSAVWKLL